MIVRPLSSAIEKSDAVTRIVPPTHSTTLASVQSLARRISGWAFPIAPGDSDCFILLKRLVTQRATSMQRNNDAFAWIWKAVAKVLNPDCHLNVTGNGTRDFENRTIVKNVPDVCFHYSTPHRRLTFAMSRGALVPSIFTR